MCFICSSPLETLASTLEEILVRGNRRVNADIIFSVISTHRGDSYDEIKVNQDIKEIYKLGFFSQVTAGLEKEGRILVFRVSEKPAIRNVVFEGNDEISDEQLKEVILLESARFIDMRKVKESVSLIKQHYLDEGFVEAYVELKIEPVQGNDNEVDVIFSIEEGEQKKIRKINFMGNHVFSSEDLLNALASSEYSDWWSWLTGSGFYHQTKTQADIAFISRKYLQNGYVDVKVGLPEVEELGDGWINLIYKIEEGKQFQLGHISISGHLLEEEKDEVYKTIKVKSGKIFNIDQIRSDTEAVAFLFSDRGYAFANVEPLTLLNREHHVVNLEFRVDKGPLVNIAQVLLTGNTKTRDNVIRRSLKFSEGDIYSSSNVKRSEELLLRLGFFEEVSITSEENNVPGTINMIVAVEEDVTTTFNIGVGLSSNNGFIFSTNLQDSNIFGTGNTLGLELETGTKYEQYVLRFKNPRLFDSYWSGGIEFFSTKRDMSTFDRSQVGGALSLGYPLWFLGEETFDDMRFSLTYQNVQTDIDNLSSTAPQRVVDEEGKSRISSLTPRLIRDTINNPLDPTHGSRQSLSYEWAHLGGDDKFWLLGLGNAFYYPLIEWDSSSLVFSNRTRYNIGEAIAGSNNDLLPLSRRFFLGGINSVRGYSSNSISPRDENGEKFGGNKSFTNNTELIFPIAPSIHLKGVVFFDVGGAFDDHQNMEFGDMKKSLGWGIRWRTPIAPVRVEFGFPLDDISGEDSSFETHFSFGVPLF